MFIFRHLFSRCPWLNNLFKGGSCGLHFCLTHACKLYNVHGNNFFVDLEYESYICTVALTSTQIDHSKLSNHWKRYIYSNKAVITCSKCCACNMHVTPNLHAYMTVTYMLHTCNMSVKVTCMLQ